MESNVIRGFKHFFGFLVPKILSKILRNFFEIIFLVKNVPKICFKLLQNRDRELLLHQNHEKQVQSAYLHFLSSNNDDFHNFANRSFKSALPGCSPSIKISGLIISGRYLAILNGACLGNAMFHEVGADTGAGNVRPRNSVWWCSARPVWCSTQTRKTHVNYHTAPPPLPGRFLELNPRHESACNNCCGMEHRLSDF